MSNPRLTPKEYGLLKGDIRRIFSRSPLRNEVMRKNIIEHTDENRPAVKTWVFCSECGIIDAKSYMSVDHIFPVVDVTSSMKEMSFDELIDKIWCDSSNLQLLCKACHLAKSKLENKQRREYKKSQKST